MDVLAFWQQKLLQVLHDPPAKPYDSIPGAKGEARGGHEAVAKKIATMIAMDKESRGKIGYFRKVPDLAATGADRPVFPGSRGEKNQIRVWWPQNPLITHPLSPGCRILLNRSDIDENTAGARARREIVGIEDETAESLEEDLDGSIQGDGVWNNEKELERRFYKIWRKLRHLLIHQGPDGDPDPVFRHLWQTMPADSRCPDHTIWEHNRLTSALAFITQAKKEDNPRAPWLFRFEIGPVGRFIEEARTSRDLWIGSFLLSDLIWHAMRPVIDRYGPDCVIYPDLCGNPRADVWLKEERPETLPESIDNPATYAAVLPNAFTAVVPRGQVGCLVDLGELAKEAQKAMQDRWTGLANLVEAWLANIQAEKGKDSGEWRAAWKRQHEGVLSATWSAVRWSHPEEIEHPESLSYPDSPPCRTPREAPPPKMPWQRIKRRSRPGKEGSGPLLQKRHGIITVV